MNILRKPQWLRVSRQTNQQYAQVNQLIQQGCLNTICKSGKCPNQAECWSNGTATFMLLGDICTRGCRFCATKTGRPLPPNPIEPHQLAKSVALMKLKHVVLTSVTRDDLPDQGANHWNLCITAIKILNPNTTIEALTPDFQAQAQLIKTVLDAKPHIFAHNIETVEQLTPHVRAKATYKQSLNTLYIAKQLCPDIPTKSSFMLGLGENKQQILQTMDDLRNVGVTILTIGQYLQPSKQHLPVQQYITPEQFQQYKLIALDKGFTHVQSAPLVRSSYHAEKALQNTLAQ
ncbi:MAG: lipoyl synthase [Paludibacteraceae bacterium]|nr:lipoyl synthase [Paludibacteraceae bacterium]